jgi:hypothetical protein
MRFLRLFMRANPERTPPPQTVRQFLSALSRIAPPAGLGAYGFKSVDGGSFGFVQFIINSPTSLTIHRLWTHRQGGATDR